MAGECRPVVIQNLTMPIPIVVKDERGDGVLIYAEGAVWDCRGVRLTLRIEYWSDDRETRIIDHINVDITKAVEEAMGRKISPP